MPKITIALLLLLSPTARADAPAATATRAAAPRDIPEGGLYLGLGPGGALDARAAGVGGSLIVDRRLWRRLGLLIEGEYGYLGVAPEAHLLLRLAIGPRVELWANRDRLVRLQAALEFVHEHEATVSVWRDHTADALFGESKGGLGHRSGVGAELQLVLTPFLRLRPQGLRRLRTLVRAVFDWLPDQQGPAFYLSGQVALGYAI